MKKIILMVFVLCGLGFSELTAKEWQGRITSLQMLLEQGQNNKAEILANENYKLAKLDFPEDDLMWGVVNFYLGVVSINKESFNEAQNFLDVSIKVLSSKGRSGKSLLNSALMQKALLYQKTHQYKLSEDTFKKVLKSQIEISGEGSVQALNVESNLGALYFEVGRFDEAIKSAEFVLEGFQNTMGENHPLTARSRGNLAMFYSSTNNNSKAKEIFLKSLSIQEAQKPVLKATLASTLNNLAGVCMRTEEFELAESYYLRSLKLTKEVYGDKHSQYAGALMNLGSVSMDLNKDVKAIDYYLEALGIIEKTGASPDVIYNNLAMLSQKVKDYETAEFYFLKSLRWNEKQFGGEHPNVATTLNNLAYLYSVQKKFDKGISYYKKSIALFKKLLGESNPRVISTLSNLGRVYKEMNNRAEFDKILEEIGRLKRLNP